jgi:hypothetical protein
LQDAHDWWQLRQGQLSQQIHAEQEAALQRDLSRIVEAYGAPLREHLLTLDWKQAGDLLDELIGSLETESYRHLLEEDTRRLRRSGRLFGRFLEQLGEGELPPRPAIKLASMDRSAEVVGHELAQRMFKVQVSSGVGVVRKTMPFAEFATPDGLRQLIWQRMDLQPEDKEAFLEALLWIEISRWADQVWALDPMLEVYDQLAGWPGPRPLKPLAKPTVMETWEQISGSDASLAQDFPELVEALNRESSCHEMIVSALGPFVGGGSLGWSEAHDLLQRSFTEHRDSLFLRMVYLLIDRELNHPLTPGEP